MNSVGHTEHQPARVLHVVSAMDRGGAETMLMNLYRHIDRGLLQFDFLVHREPPGHYDAEIEELGGRVIKIHSLRESGPISYVSEARRAIKASGPFAAIHMHTNIRSGLVALAARKAGVQKRICHSHTSGGIGRVPTLPQRVLDAALRALIRANVTHFYACGRDAAEYLFGRRICSIPGKVVVLPNAVDLAEFEALRESGAGDIRTDLGVAPNEKIICHIGRFTPEKNHRFLIELAGHLKQAGIQCVFLLVGDGPLRPEMEELAGRTGLSGFMRFLGVRPDVPRLFTTADTMILPSLYEGLPVVMVEAQAAGLPCLISSNVSDEADMGLGLVRKVSLQAPIESWIEAVVESASRGGRPPSSEIRKKLTARGYDVAGNVNHLYELYGISRPDERQP